MAPGFGVTNVASGGRTARLQRPSPLRRACPLVAPER